MAVRLALLDHHYRSDWEWSPADLASAETRLARWRHAVAAVSGPPAEPVVADVRSRLADDLDAPRALAAVDRWVREVELAHGDDTAAPREVRALVDALLGVDLGP